MLHTNKKPQRQFRPAMRIIGLNTGKTRRARGSYTAYQVYFDLSANPPLSWNQIFRREWRDLGSTEGVEIDGMCLVIQCPIQDVASTHLPALKEAVDATNTAFTEYAREQAAEEAHRASVASDDQKVIEAVAKSLRFD